MTECDLKATRGIKLYIPSAKELRQIVICRGLLDSEMRLCKLQGKIKL